MIFCAWGLAKNMGTSADMIKKHHKRVVPKLEAEKIWALLLRSGRTL